jgi:hypothetical protein
VLGGAGFRDGKRFFEFGPPPPEQQPPELIELMEKMKLEHEKLKLARENLLLELRADAEKTQANNATKLQIEGMKSETAVGKQVIDIHAEREARQESAQHDRLMRLIDDLSSGTDNGAARPREAPAEPRPAHQQGGDEFNLPATTEEPGQGLMQQQDPALGQQIMAEAIFDQLRQFAEQLRIVGDMVNHLDQKISAPVEVVRDAENRPVAVRKAGQLQMIERNPDGVITGTTPIAQHTDGDKAVSNLRFCPYGKMRTM